MPDQREAHTVPLVRNLAVVTQLHLPGTAGRLAQQIRDLEAAAPAFAPPALPTAAGLAAADFFSQGLDNPRVRQEITVNVNGGLGTSAEIGAAVVNSIRQYNQVNGPAPIAVA